MSWLSPSMWNDIGVVSLLVILSGLGWLAIVKRWLVPGKHHAEIVTARDAEIAELRARGHEDAATINTLSTALAKKDAAEDLATKVLAAIREGAQSK